MNEQVKQWEVIGDKQAPIIFQVEGTTVDATSASIEVRGWSTDDLVSFGNYMVSAQRENLIDQHPELITPEDKEAAYHQVSDADLSNWRFLFYKNAHAIREAMWSDDESL